ncbi:MFS general substrate transporter [Macrolepiota fuliginosa MF-IS2]|uniref:MFS general substrate transporter n=1 Tax=Macrolepiota fuliginosa MF-IS2 TaxID=1400762 RepID=A0A9P5XLP0_9AGAR|nr:MFS general substrate transporter [Macrolepiota fuliginosa MF-IS2]
MDDDESQPAERAPLLREELLHVENNPKRTPLPFGQLSIPLFLRFCESASWSSIFPFINNLLLSLTGGDETKVAYYASIMDVSGNTLALLAGMWWGRISDYVGRKPVILLGTAAMVISLLLVGVSKTFWILVLSNAGIIKSAIGEMADDTNRADAFALLHVPWAIGTPLIGGSLANPHTRFPDLFSGKLWQDFPYLLPCATVAFASSLGFLILLICFRETLPRNTTLEPTSNPPPAVRTLLTRRVLLSASSYVLISFSHGAYLAIQPLFLAMPIPIGGLSLQPTQIGYILGFYGFYNSLVQTFLPGRLVRQFGLRTVLGATIFVFIPIFLLFPLMNVYAKDWYFYQHRDGHTYSRFIMHALLAIQLCLLSIGEMGYGCTYMYINSSAPSRRSLGSVNGLAQAAGSIARLVGPGLANAVLGLSIERGWMGGYAVYFLLCLLTVGSVGLVGLLPRGVWEAENN